MYVRATCFDLVGHPQALQGNRSKSCLVFLQYGIPNAHRFFARHCLLKQMFAQHFKSLDLVFLYWLMELAWPTINLKFSIPKCYNKQLNTIRQSVTQHLFYIQWYICHGDMFWPSQSSSGPPRKQIHELFSFPALWDPKCSQLVSIWDMSPWHIYRCI